MKQLTLSFTILVIFGLTGCTSATPPPPPPTATVISLLTQPTTVNVEPIAQVATATPLPVPSATPAPLPPPSATAASLPTATLTPLPTATSTPVPTSTPTPLPTDTSTPAAPVVQLPLTSTTTINIRSGPGTAYPILAQLEPGQTAPLTGRNDDTSWWQISLADNTGVGWVFGELVAFSGSAEAIPVAAAPPPPPTATPAPAPPPQEDNNSSPASAENQPPTTSGLRQQLNCTQDFCVTYQAMLPIWENGGCIGNHSIYVTVLEGPPPGRPMDGVVIGDTFNNVEVASGDKGPGSAEITLWMNSMAVKVKRHINGTPFTSQESFSFTSHDELIPAEVLAANGYCDGSIEKCRWAQQNNQVCRGHYSYRVTFHKLD